MRRFLLALVACAIAFYTTLVPAGPSTAGNPAEYAIACEGVGSHTGRLYRTLFGRQPDAGGLSYWVNQRLVEGMNGEDVAYWMTQSAEYQQLYGQLDDAQFVDAIYQNLLGRDADPGGHAYWLQLVQLDGRHSVVSWMTQTEEFATVWPYIEPSMCNKVAELDMTEVRPGLAVRRTGNTVTVLADRTLVAFDAADGGARSINGIGGDVVVNANWFTAAGSQAPVISNGVLSGSADTVERGQVVAYAPGCAGYDGPLLRHVWMGEIYQHNGCAVAAVSGVSLVHKGLRADSYPGFDITNGYTNTSPAHSFIGFNDTELVVISSTELNASQLADYAISLGVHEGVMLDGGGSTQIRTPITSLTSVRPVTAFAILDSRH